MAFSDSNSRSLPASEACIPPYLALKLVESGEAAYGIIYASDAVGDDKVAVVGTFPQDSHKPIVYPAAVMTTSTAPEAQAFLDDLFSDAAVSIFTAQGFIVLK